MRKTPTEKKSIPVGLRLRPSLKSTLDQIAASERRPLAQLIANLLEDYAVEQDALRSASRPQLRR